MYVQSVTYLRSLDNFVTVAGVRAIDTDDSFVSGRQHCLQYQHGVGTY